MKRIISIIAAFLIIWALGLFLSNRTTERSASDFYEWLCLECDIPNNRPPDLMHGIQFPIRGRDLTKRLSKCTEPFKDHVFICSGGKPERESLKPKLYFMTKHSSGTKGTWSLGGVTLSGSFFFSPLLVKIDEGEKQTQDLFLFVNTELFGLKVRDQSAQCTK